MHSRYEVTVREGGYVYEFVSEGRRGSVAKVIQYLGSLVPNECCLVLADTDSITGGLDDSGITNNGDTKKILATVLWSLDDFTKRNPNALIYIIGNTASRTRLYKINISNNLIEISKLFTVQGLKNGEWEDYTIGNSYEAFSFERKR
jgi:hypothetical protein